MRCSTGLVGAFALHALAFPSVLNELDARASQPAPGSKAAKKLSASRGNCGVVPCTTFSEDQFVSTSGQYAYTKPTRSQIRGPCPGLNAAANHGYISRSGILTFQDTVLGLQNAYGMAPDLGAFLAAFAILVDGDPIAGTWSIGGPTPTDPLTKSLLGQAQGISYSHNNYEGDASIARGDAYLNNGDAHSLQIERFKSAYKATASKDRYTLDAFAKNFQKKSDESIATNPYAFFAPFAGLVAPAAYNFVINFMSNHTAEEPSGYLDGEMFKQFFAVTGDYPNFEWKRGQERIPENWYKRSADNEYSIAGVFGDLIPQFLAYPSSLRFGGNTGKVNTFTGVDLGKLSDGAYNGKTLLQGNNLACFFAQFAQAGIPDAASLPLQLANPITSLVNKGISPVVGNLNCPAVGKFDQTLFNKYPGYKYHPKGKATNYKV